MAAEFTDPAAAAERAAALTGLLTGPLAGGRPAGASEVAAVLRDFGEPEPITITDADLAGLRRVAAALRQVFAAPDAGTAARLLNDLLAASAGPPRLSRHDGTAWHVHVDREDDAAWADWFAASSAAGLATVLASLAGGAGRPVRGAGLRGPVRGHGRRLAAPLLLRALRQPGPGDGLPGPLGPLGPPLSYFSATPQYSQREPSESARTGSSQPHSPTQVTSRSAPG